MEEDDLAGIVTWSLTGSHATSPDYYIGHICEVQSNFDVAVAGLRHVTQGRWSLGLCPLRSTLHAGHGSPKNGGGHSGHCDVRLLAQSGRRPLVAFECLPVAEAVEKVPEGKIFETMIQSSVLH